MNKRFRNQLQNDDIIYYNFNLVNNNEFSIPATSQESLSGPIITDADDYFVTAVRFVLDGSDIPLFIFKDETYYITFSLNGVDTAPMAVEYIAYNTKHNQQSVYNYESFVNMINVTLAALDAATGNVGGATVPFMYYTNGKINLYVPTAYLVGGTIVKIYFNSLLYGFFGNFFAQFNGEGLATKKDYEIIIQNVAGINTHDFNTFIPTNYILLTQEFQSLYNWFDMTGIVFTSNTLGVKNEYIPTQNTSMSSTTNSGNSGAGQASAPIVTDFQPYYSPDDIAGPRGYLYYAASGPYRLINMQNNSVTKIDLNIFLRDRVGQQYQYFIPPKQSVQVKIAFIKKNLYKSTHQ